MLRYVIDKGDTSNLVILRKVLKINRVKTSLFKPIELFITLNNICNIKFAL